MQQYNDDKKNASLVWRFSFSKNKNIRLYVIIAVLLLLYIVEINTIGIAIPCLFNLLTGLKCPGCGVTRLVTAIIHFDFAEAFYFNPFILITSPILIYFIGKSTLIDCGIIHRKLSKTENAILYVYIVLFLLYGISRNIFTQIP